MALAAPAAFADFSGSAVALGGGTITYNNVAATNWVDGELVLKFTTVGGTHNFSVTGPTVADILVVGGGGAGGSGVNYTKYNGKYVGGGGGGGAGGLVLSNDLILANGQYDVTVGAGGAKPASVSAATSGANGQPSSLRKGGVLVVDEALGGGGGGAQSEGLAGASGGGGSKQQSSNVAGKAKDGGAATQGYAGGKGNANLVGAGGGGCRGAAAEVTSKNLCPTGGLGLVSSIFGTSTCYAAGGGGGVLTDAGTAADNPSGSGVAGGPGAGGLRNAVAAKDGAAGTGGGGGGCGRDMDNPASAMNIGGAGGSGVVIVRIKAALADDPLPPVSTNLVYDGQAHAVIAPSVAYTVDPPNAAGTDVGSYPATATLKPGFKWRVGSAVTGPTDPVAVTLTIDPTPTTIEGLRLDSWMVGAPANEPTCAVKPACVADQATVSYAYASRDDAGEAVGDWRDDAPTAIGNYLVRATVDAAKNWLATNAVAPFAIVDDPRNVFRDCVEITVGPYAPAKAGDPLELTNFPYKVELGVGNPEGFLYFDADGNPRAGVDGKNLSFTTPGGAPLPYAVGSWTIDGTSTVYVRIPLIGASEQKILLFWTPREGATIPPYDESAVWSDDWPDPSSTGRVTPPPSSFGLVESDGKKVDAWVDEPLMSATTWGVTTDPSATGHVITNGSLKSLRPVGYVVVDVNAPDEPLTAMPTNAGMYRITFAPADETGYYAISRSLDIRVTEREPYSDLRGDAATQTLSGRILLSNADKATGHALDADEGQAYWQVRSLVYQRRTYTFNPYWTHEGEHGLNATTFPYIFAGTHHRLHHIVDDGARTNVLWRLLNVGVGNTFDATLALKAEQCYLPWSTTGLGISEYAQRNTAGSQKEAGQLQLLNEIDAMVCSPCYTNGIGTIYFDAVNGWTRDIDKDAYRIVVEVATEVVDDEGRVLPPTDENAGDELERIKSYDPRQPGDTKGRWHPVTMHPLKRDDGAVNFAALDPTEDLSLKVRGDASKNNFYRIYVPINVEKPMRFRIRRASVAEGRSDCHVLLDNIVVSYPGNDAEMASYGRYDGPVKPGETGRCELGVKGAMTVAFPSVGDGTVRGRGKPVFKPTSGYVDRATNFIQLVRMHYRWRYLDQAYDPADSNEWKTVDLVRRDSPTGEGVDFASAVPLDVPSREGDVEYWYESFLKLPFFDYYDYSGAGIGLGGWYSEEKSLVTNRMTSAERRGKGLGSMGQDWFYRLRLGKSDFEELRLLVKTAADGAVATNHMALAGDHKWRGTFQTKDPLADGLWVRFEMLNQQAADDGAYALNARAMRLAADVEALPAMGTLANAGADEWTHLPCDALTGYLLFQIEDETLGCTVVHADRQDFNAWNDANVPDPENGIFVGNSTETSGVSSVTRECPDEIARWHESAATNKLWQERFSVAASEMAAGKAWAINVPFDAAKTPNGLSAGPGMWVAERYRDTATGMALQMDVKRNGYLQFVDAAATPRGFESLSFGARLAQGISFGDFSYYVGGSAPDLTNYTFVVRGAYDLTNRVDFTGNASLSLVAGYIAGLGCYELRVEQEKATASGAAPSNKQRLTLYRWTYDRATGDYKATSLKTAETGDSKDWLTTSGENGKFSALFISLEVRADKTLITGGVTKVLEVGSAVSNLDTTWVTATDTTGRFTDYDGNPIGGAYGLLAANCPGWFVKPEIGKATSSTAGKFDDSSLGLTSCRADIVGRRWFLNEQRLEYFRNSDKFFGLKAAACTQPLVVYTAPKGTANWSEFLKTNITSYATQEIVFDLWTNLNCAVKLAPGKVSGSLQTDLVIDDFLLRQWCGESYNDEEGQLYFDTPASGSPTNFVFTQGWNLRDEGTGEIRCQLNARRAQPGKALSIRSPMMDGGAGRGIGLGMFSFTYTNAQEDVELLFQVATNVNDVSVNGLPSLTDAVADKDPVPGQKWATITNWSFRGLSAAERASGTRSYYLGWHGVKGVMRVAMRPKVVTDAAALRDATKFPSIEITSVYCTDEPSLDRFAWWGWNLRTTDDPSMRSLGDYYVDRAKSGLTVGLNNSIDRKAGELRPEAEFSQNAYAKHLPFVQTPQFAGDVVGEVCFRARKYRRTDGDTRVVLFGAKTGVAEDSGWHYLTNFTVQVDTFKTFAYKTLAGDSYSAFRFVVTGVDGVDSPKMADGAPDDPQPRVLLDDVLVMEAIRAKVAFRNVSAFRTGLETRVPLEDILDRAQQPLCKESWGVQAEVYAAQLADEVDLASAEVKLLWYEYAEPWGYERWKSRPGAKSAWLVRCEGEPGDGRYVFRSSYDGAEAAVMRDQAAPTTVQYMLEVHYRNKDGSEGVHLLDVENGEWRTPSWYAPIDLNADKSGGFSYSAYTVLDTVAPGWAWINEVNVFGGYDPNFNNVDKPYQFVEIAAPFDADLTEWTLRSVDAQFDSRGTVKQIVTNDLARFGDNLPGLKKYQGKMDVGSRCVFHVVASPYVTSFDPATGEIDGRWKVTKKNNAVTTGGEISSSYPLALQLVRPSGVVEHEIVALGTNDWAASSSQYNPDRHVDILNAGERGGRWFYVGMDVNGGTPGMDGSKSLGVHRGHGGTEKTLAEDVTYYWNATNHMTPGGLNGGQRIDDTAPQPLGSALVIVSQLEGAHVTQTFGEAVRTNETVAIVFRKGNKDGTNIVYHVDRWFELAKLQGNGKDLPVPTPVRTPTGFDFVVNVAKNASNDLTVVAATDILKALQDAKYGLGPENRYREAVASWLGGGRTLYGPFSGPHKDEDVLGLAEYRSLNGKIVTNMTLTAMYWLDMDPTWNDGDLWLRAGTKQLDASAVAPNSLMSVKMMITNTSPWATAGIGPGKACWAPYVLQSSRPGVNSWNYETAAPGWLWNDVTFKVTGLLANGKTDPKNRASWLPLRWFVFDTGSFDANFESLIEIVDPLSTASPGYTAGWYQWVKDNPDKSFSIWFKWDIDDRLRPQGVETLKADSTY